MADNSSGMNAIVAVIAIIVIAVVAYYAVTMLRASDTDNGGGTGINVDVDGAMDGDAMDGQ